MSVSPSLPPYFSLRTVQRLTARAVAAEARVAALTQVAEAAQRLLTDLDDAIAGADLEAWDAPYRIEAPLFRKSADDVRSTLRALDGLVGLHEQEQK